MGGGLPMPLPKAPRGCLVKTSRRRRSGHDRSRGLIARYTGERLTRLTIV